MAAVAERHDDSCRRHNRRPCCVRLRSMMKSHRERQSVTAWRRFRTVRGVPKRRHPNRERPLVLKTFPPPRATTSETYRFRTLHYHHRFARRRVRVRLQSWRTRRIDRYPNSPATRTSIRPLYPPVARRRRPLLSPIAIASR